MKRNIIYHSMPVYDRHYKKMVCTFTLLWESNYHPGHPNGEYFKGMRGQVFYSDPRDYGFNLPNSVYELERKYNEPKRIIERKVNN